jgi:hypothetical protein
VVRHKTAHFYGAAAIPLFDENFYHIICDYWKTFQEHRYDVVTGKEFVFASSNFTAPKVKDALEWLKEEVLVNEFGRTMESLKKLTPEVFRHAWSQWIQEDQDPEIRKLGPRVMGHSASTQTRNYDARSGKEAVKVANRVLSNLTGKTKSKGWGIPEPSDEGPKEKKSKRTEPDDSGESDSDDSASGSFADKDSAPPPPKAARPSWSHRKKAKVGKRSGKGSWVGWSQKNKQLVWRTLCPGGIAPQSFSQDSIRGFCERSEEFRDFFENKLVPEKGDKRTACNSLGQICKRFKKKN